MRTRFPPMPDDGLVALRNGLLVTPEAAHARAAHIMAGFDQLSPLERHAWNYATTEFNGSRPVAARRRDRRETAKVGARLLLAEAGI